MAAASSNNGHDEDLPPEKNDQADTGSDKGSDKGSHEGSDKASDKDAEEGTKFWTTEGEMKYWCKYCNQMLNGKKQACEHIIGKNHRKNTKASRIVLPDNGMHTLSFQSYSILSDILHGGGK